MTDITLPKIRAWCKAQGVTEKKEVMRAYKRAYAGLPRDRWLGPKRKVKGTISGMSMQEVADWINEQIDAGVTAHDVYVHRRDQLKQHPQRTDGWLVAYMLPTFFARKYKPAKDQWIENGK